MIIQSFTDMEKLIELLDTKPDVKDDPDAEVLALQGTGSPSVVFENVRFAYNDNALLDGISFRYGI